MATLKENETRELKRSTSELKEALCSIVAMLNKSGKGEVYFGVRNDGTIVGQQVTERTLREVSQAIADHVEPVIFPTVEHISLEGKSGVKVVFAGGNKPYFAFGRAYIRVGDEDRQLSQPELKRMIVEQSTRQWEKEISAKTVRDANVRVVKDFVKKANSAKRISFAFTSTRTVLDKLHLLYDGKLLNAGEVLFCNENSLEVQAAVFAGTDKLTFLDIQSFKGNLFYLLEKSENYLKEHMNWRALLEPEGRTEIPEVPLRAITEALVNSLCHRDYTNPKGNEIAIFKDRIEIYNPGSFPEGYTPQQFIRGEERSILRNPLLANILYLRDDIEKWGSGIRRIAQACREAGVRMEFKVIKSGFVTVFYRTEKKFPEHQHRTEPVLTGRQKRIIAYLRKENMITTGTCAVQLKVSNDTALRELSRLESLRLIIRKGIGRGVYYVLA